jgi:hypothetical protein
MQAFRELSTCSAVGIVLESKEQAIGQPLGIRMIH